MQFLSKYSVMELFRENAFNIKFYRYHVYDLVYTFNITRAHDFIYFIQTRVNCYLFVRLYDADTNGGEL